MARQIVTRLGDLMRLARHNLALDQREFAHHVAVSTRTVSRWENAEQRPTHEQRAMIVRVLSGAPRDVVDEIARQLGVASPYPPPPPVVVAAPPAADPPRPSDADVRAAFDAVVFAAAEERDVLPRHLRAFGVELLLAVDRVGLGPRQAAAFVAARERAPARKSP